MKKASLLLSGTLPLLALGGQEILTAKPTGNILRRYRKRVNLNDAKFRAKAIRRHRNRIARASRVANH